MRTVKVTRTYLEVRKGRFRPVPRRPAGLRVHRVTECAAAFYRFMYCEIGRANYWTDRVAWSDEKIRTHLARPEISLWVMMLKGGPIGYFELVRLHADEYEINYLGLLPEYQGQGLGKHLLTAAVQTCWRLGARRAQLDTCTLDHPSALANYLKRGFAAYARETFYRMLPVTAAETKRFRSTGTKGRMEYG